MVFEEALYKYPSLTGVCGDGGYRGTFVDYVQLALYCMVEIVLKLPKGWKVLPKRWIVERTFAWLNPFRRLSKAYEITTGSEESFVTLAHSRLFLKRLSYP